MVTHLAALSCFNPMFSLVRRWCFMITSNSGIEIWAWKPIELFRWQLPVAVLQSSGSCIRILHELLFPDGLMSGLGIARLVSICSREADEVNSRWNLVAMYETLTKHPSRTGLRHITRVSITKPLITLGLRPPEEPRSGISHACLCIIACTRRNTSTPSTSSTYCRRSGGVHRLVTKRRRAKYAFELYRGSPQCALLTLHITQL